jgi:AcrR family transcriptional regulator
MSLESESKAVEILGLRERKKRRTREAIAEAAVGLFLKHGFDQVSVSHVAAAADVSKVTVFNYFPTKEDLVLSRIAYQVDLPAQVVRSRAEGETPLQALQRDYLRRLAERDPSTGTCADEHVLAIQRMILASPALTMRMTHHMLSSEESLCAALDEEIGESMNGVVARVTAAQFLATERALADRNLHRLLNGIDPDRLYRDAVAEADLAYGVLARGVASTGCRWGVPAEARIAGPRESRLAEARLTDPRLAEFRN